MNKIQLKRVVTHNNKSIIYFIMTAIFLTLYFGAGTISYQRAIILSMPLFEEEIPFWTWTIWVYIVLYPVYLVWALYSYQKISDMNKTFYGFLALTVISCGLFILFPVTYPREVFPLPINEEVTTLIFRLMRKADRPSNCLPSLHVGICYFFCFAFKNESRSKFWAAFIISTAVSVSTLTTKQHYIYDILGGFLLALGIHLFFDQCTVIKDSSASTSPPKC